MHHVTCMSHYCHTPHRILRQRTSQCCDIDDIIPKNRVFLTYALTHTHTHTHKHIITQAHTHTHPHSTHTHTYALFLFRQDGNREQSIWPHLALFDPTFRRRSLPFQYKCETVHFPHQEKRTQNRPIKMHNTVRIFLRFYLTKSHS